MTMQDAAAGWRAVVGAVLFCVAGGSSGAGSLPPGPEVFGAAPAVESVALNPSGTWVAWADVRKEEQYAVAVEVATGAMRRSPVHPDMKLRGVLWADDDTLLLRTSMARPGPGDRTTLYEFHRIVAVDITTTGQNRVLLMDDDARAWVTGATIVSSRTAQPGTVIMSSWDYSKASQWTHDLFSVDVLAPVHTKQLLTYLRLADKRVGLLLNFGAYLMKDGIRRVVNDFER